MKKKTIAVLLLGVLLLVAGPMALFASGHGGGRQFVDLDGDGVCDNRGMQCAQFVGGHHGLNGAGNGHCGQYIDENGDGVCDHCSAQGTIDGTNCPVNGRADADGDGVCDNRGLGYGMGYKHGHGCRQ